MTTALNNCYGNYDSRSACRSCCYRTSCRYYTNNPINDRRKNCECVNYDEIANWAETAADTSNIPGETADAQSDFIGIDKLADFFRYLLNLDKYTLDILKMIFDDCNPVREVPSVAEIAGTRGCSRQAVHRKILDIIKKHPELTGLFSLTLRHLPRNRRRYAGA